MKVWHIGELAMRTAAFGSGARLPGPDAVELVLKGPTGSGTPQRSEMDIYEVAYMFNGIEHHVDVAAVNGPDAAFRVGQNLYPSAEYRGVRLVKRPIDLGDIALGDVTNV